MAKKKSGLKTIAIAGVGLTIVVLTPLFLLFAGIEVPIIGKAYADALGVNIAPQGDPEGFEIPVIPQEDIDDVTEEIIDLIDDVSNTGQCGFEQIDPVTGEEPSCLLPEDGSNPPVCINFEERIEDQCEMGTPIDEVFDEIEEVIDEFEETVPEIPDLNQTETSNDPPIDQIIDDLEPPFIEPPTPKVKLLTNVVKIDATLNRFNSTTTTDVPALSFFVEDTTNIDFTNGFIEIKMEIETFPNSIVNGIGDFDLFVGDQSIFSQPIKAEVSGTTDENGRQTLFFISPSGARSEIFTFSFENEADKFPTMGVTAIIFKANQFDITVDTDNEFRLGDNTLFAMTVATNPNEVIIMDEQGELVRAFPTDDRFIIRSSTISFSARAPCTLSGAYGAGCTSNYCRTYDVPPSTRCEGSRLYTAGTVPAPAITGIILFENGVFVKSILGGTNGIVFDEMLTRDTNYTITIADPSVTFDFTTPKSQKNYDFKCWGKTIGQYGISGYNTNGNVVITGSICPTATYCSDAIRAGASPPFRVTGTTCNFQ